MQQDNFDRLEIGELMARYARLSKRLEKMLVELEAIRCLIKENV